MQYTALCIIRFKRIDLLICGIGFNRFPNKGGDMPKVIVYSTPVCPWCTRVKQFLEEHGIQFEEIDVSVNQEKAAEMVQRSGQMSVPVLDIGGTIIVGFDRPAIVKALKLRD